MFSFITGLNPKVYLVAALLLFIVSTAGYVNNLKSNLEDKEVELKTTSLKLDEANRNNVLMHEAYEKTLAIEREISEQKLQNQEQKEKVVVKYKTLEKEVEKRGEVKQDEKSNFTIVTF